jgi:hypothetical protein
MKSYFYLLIVLLLVSCDKAEDRECIKAAGKETSLSIALPSFQKLHVGPKIEVVLIQDTENKLVIHGRDNLVKHISYDINSEGFLDLKNKNRCDFLRSYKKNKVKVEVHFVDLNELLFEGTIDLKNEGVLTTNNFKLMIQDGGATVSLNLNCQSIDAVQGHGYGDFVLTGSCQNLYAKITSNGFCDLTGLTTVNNLIFISNTPVLSLVNLQGATADVEINGSGNVKYIGYPSSLNYVRYGTGELVDGN